MTTPHYLDSAYVQALIAENAALKATVNKLVACWPGGETYEALKAAVEAYRTAETRERELDEYWTNPPEPQDEWEVYDSQYSEWSHAQTMVEDAFAAIATVACNYVYNVEAAREGGE